MEPPAIALTAIMHQVRLECLVQLLALRPVELIALDRQCAEALAYLVPNPLIAGVVDAAVEAGKTSLLAQILPEGRLLSEHGVNQDRSPAGNDRGVRDVGGMVWLRDQQHDGVVRLCLTHFVAPCPGEGPGRVRTPLCVVLVQRQRCRSCL